MEELFLSAHSERHRCDFVCRLPLLESSIPQVTMKLELRTKEMTKNSVYTSVTTNLLNRRCQERRLCQVSKSNLSLSSDVYLWPMNQNLTVSSHCPTDHLCKFATKSVHPFLSASLYVSKRGACWDRLCRDGVGCHAPALWPNGAS